MAGRRTSRNNSYSSGVNPSGFFRAEVVAENGEYISAKIPKLGLDNIYDRIPVVGEVPDVSDSVWVSFIEGQAGHMLAFSGASEGSSTVTISDTPPLDAEAGDLWFESDTTNFYIFYDDVWVEIGGASVGNIIDMSDDPPDTPAHGDLWFNPSQGILYIYDDDLDMWTPIVASARAAGSVGQVQYNLNGALAGASGFQYDYYSGGVSVEGQVAASSPDDVTGPGTGSLLVGYTGATSSHIAMDGNEIQAYASGAPASLHLNIEGSPKGKVSVGGDLSVAGSLMVGGDDISVDGHTHSYLPLSGGQLTGALDIQGGNAVLNLRNSASTSRPYMSFYYNGTRAGYIGYPSASSGGVTILHADGNTLQLSGAKVQVVPELQVDTRVRTNIVTNRTGQQLVLNAGESEGKPIGAQTGEFVYVNAEGGLRVTTPSVGNWGAGYADRITTITGTGITVNGKAVSVSGHTHSYSPTNHTHSYSPTNHTHSEYAPTHSHPYAATSHTHSYSPTTHTHSYLPLTGGTLTGSLKFKYGSTTVGDIKGSDTTWLRINQDTNKNIYTPRYIRADNGLYVDGTSYGVDGGGNIKANYLYTFQKGMYFNRSNSWTNQIGFYWNGSNAYISVDADAGLFYIGGASDSRVKDNVETMTDGLAYVRQLRPVRYNPIPVGADPILPPFGPGDDGDDGDDAAVYRAPKSWAREALEGTASVERFAGLIAQEVRDVVDADNIVEGEETDTSLMSITYQLLVPYLISALQTLDEQQQDILQRLDSTP